ncbi:bifunctional phosphoribosyl-AMP cyclohydrolase/phosphoribosyl-ATP diphosphatase HisIE [bacterium]|nr:bifunctional phosphoribosyl-AMP cyclohydrolase/phosphoribosyl-ATP diphosphatase HisIE [bacterium]
MKRIDWHKNGSGLAPAVIQDSATRRVLMVGYMNEEALKKTAAEGRVTFYSRTRNRLWTKGETSGNRLYVEAIQEDCDADTLLIQVRPEGPVCHTGADTCFGEKNERPFLNALERLIQERKRTLPDGSYTASLFRQGINRIARKVGEEAAELIIEAKDNDRDLFLNEAADLLFHFLVLLVEKECTLDEVIGVLKERG